MIMKNCLLLGALLMGFTGVAMAQSVTVDVAPAPAPAYRPHPYVRHLASVGEGMVIEHQIDDHHH
ncbi:hypothetical protein AAB064_004181 [Escherichia coli]|uniref:hypothetical protein n=1 Tax=Escherichia coli TaxID=562 RepID=UPI000C32FB9E|nr:hypothetical protein [Escherichia coli]EEW5986898.1 hypothetical protein [Escherichia coli]EEY5237782.1 hypothetical protein [Escherichia coli]EFC4437366.1 hypothetical protein [Escherichia coli]EFC9823433.1 hypothetical protein [Escherichia coli]EFD0992339.1 hypothetical protein [Escherichia coli]